MKKACIVLSLLLLSQATRAQEESQTAYNFLRLPVSAHAAALGGDNVSLIEDDASLLFANPALLTSATPKTISLGYMSYMAGVKAANATFNWAGGQRAAWAVTGQYVDYGQMKETNESNVQTGTFSARDMAVGGTFAYMLTDRIAGGVTARLVESYVGGYNSMGFGADLGANYYDADHDLSFSLVARNLGGQLKAYDEEYEKMPFDVQMGATKRFSSVPIRLSATVVELNHPHYKFINHVVVGGEFLPSDNFWIGLGYNFRRADEMKVSDGNSGKSHGAGLSMGAGLTLDRFKASVAYAKYHVSGGSLVMSATFSL